VNPNPVVIGGGIVTLSLVLVALWKISQIVKWVTEPFREFVREHDLLWEDYNIRTGGSYRRRTGRGNPPEPEDFYRDHHATFLGSGDGNA
jgi:hypothetical protein